MSRRSPPACRRSSTPRPCSATGLRHTRCRSPGRTSSPGRVDAAVVDRHLAAPGRGSRPARSPRRGRRRARLRSTPSTPIPFSPPHHRRRRARSRRPPGSTIPPWTIGARLTDEALRRVDDHQRPLVHAGGRWTVGGRVAQAAPPAAARRDERHRRDARPPRPSSPPSSAYDKRSAGKPAWREHLGSSHAAGEERQRRAERGARRPASRTSAITSASSSSAERHAPASPAGTGSARW